MTKLDIKESHVGNITILELNGDVTVDGSTAILQTAMQRLLKEGHIQVLLNLASIDYVDSRGLGELVASHTLLNNAGGQIKLLHLPAKVRELMDITMLLPIFDVYEDEESALESFRNGGANSKSKTSLPR
ncbi:MAG: STAS domain-containing protein [Pyrinomonadaceae bacterium]